MLGNDGGNDVDDSRYAKLELVEKVSPSLSLRDALYLAEELPFGKSTGRRILVVEDEACIAQTLRFNLERLGYLVWEAPDGREAIELAFKQKPHLILMDIMLPYVDGFQATAAIRSQMNIPIILLTAKDSEHDKIVGFEAGACDYITKPFVLADLMKRVQSYLT